MEQLAPTKQLLRRIKLKIFGSIDSGRSNLRNHYGFHEFESFRKNNTDR